MADDDPETGLEVDLDGMRDILAEEIREMGGLPPDSPYTFEELVAIIWPLYVDFEAGLIPDLLRDDWEPPPPH